MKPTIALIGFALATAVAPAVHAKPKAPPAAPTACGYKSIPLAAGNTWTYKAGPSVIVIKILGVGPGKDHTGKAATVIDVEEDYANRVIKTQWTCTAAGGLYVPLESFYYTGEPGGGVGMQLNITSRDKPWLLPEEQLVGDAAWIENVKADVVRADGAGAGAVHAPAKLEIERHVQLKGPETFTMGIGQVKTQRWFFELRGRGLVGEAKTEIPIKRPGMYWVTPGVGIVKIDDAFDKTWELTDSNLLPK
jgi:hypothetical protein